MLAEIAPHFDVTGGLIGLKDNADNVEALSGKIVKYVDQEGTASFKDLSIYVKKTGLLSQGNYSDADIASILSALVYDMKLEVVSGRD